ncbi:MAG: TetR/AcrR family transcriptional regulator [Akkermansiaceae bacterium]|jgi:AcrR family transcriptional regulator
MMDLRVKGDVTKGRLLEATERLIAEKGFDAVSVRDITGLAKANVAAVNYHFGSREGLLGALLEQRMKPIFVERAERLEALGEAASLRQVWEAWVQPLLLAVPKEGMDELTHARILGRCLEAAQASIHEEISTRGKRVDATMLRMLESLLGVRQPFEIAWLFHFGQGALIHSMTHGSAVQDEFRLSRVLDHWVGAMISQFAGAGDLVSRDGSLENHSPSQRKNPATKPLRQIAEVVAAAMEVVETPSVPVSEDTGACIDGADLPQPSSVAAETPVEQVKKSSRAKKAKPGDGMEELFLF